MAELIGQQWKDPLMAKITAIIEPSINALGFELVRVSMTGQDHNILQIMADRPDAKGSINVEDCAEISRTVSALLDVEDPINAEYNLEVSSPGMERPFFSAEQMQPYAGETIAVELNVAQQNKRKFKAQLEAVEGDQLTLLIDNETLQVSMRDVKKAQLVPTFD